MFDISDIYIISRSAYTECFLLISNLILLLLLIFWDTLGRFLSALQYSFQLFVFLNTVFLLSFFGLLLLMISLSTVVKD